MKKLQGIADCQNEWWKYIFYIPLCSPRNTSLNFRSGFPKSPDVDMITNKINEYVTQSIIFVSQQNTCIDKQKWQKQPRRRQQEWQQSVQSTTTPLHSDSSTTDKLIAALSLDWFSAAGATFNLRSFQILNETVKEWNDIKRIYYNAFHVILLIYSYKL